MNESENRLVFYADKVPMSGSEMSFLKKSESETLFKHLPKWWKLGDTLRFAHLVRMDMEKTKQVRL